MRADRLVSILLMLQSRGSIPAPELARTLGVSVRTIYRDMDALSTAGIPVYTERGSNGGCCLVENYRTDLTGLDESEAHSLFLLTAPGPLDSLDVGQKLHSALRKLAASLPGHLMSDRTSYPPIHLDWTSWNEKSDYSQALGILYRAIQQRQQVRIKYTFWLNVEVEQVVKPVGLVAKVGEWFLASLVGSKLIWNKVGDLLTVESTDLIFSYPDTFDLQSVWQETCLKWQQEQTGYSVHARISGWAFSQLRRRTGVTILPPVQEPGTNEWVEVDILFGSYEAARQNLMGLGRAIEVLSPDILRIGMADYARQILAVYDQDA